MDALNYLSGVEENNAVADVDENVLINAVVDYTAAVTNVLGGQASPTFDEILDCLRKAVCCHEEYKNATFRPDTESLRQATAELAKVVDLDTARKALPQLLMDKSREVFYAETQLYSLGSIPRITNVTVAVIPFIIGLVENIKGERIDQQGIQACEDTRVTLKKAIYCIDMLAAGVKKNPVLMGQVEVVCESYGYIPSELFGRIRVRLVERDSKCRDHVIRLRRKAFEDINAGTLDQSVFMWQDNHTGNDAKLSEGVHAVKLS